VLDDEYQTPDEAGPSTKQKPEKIPSIQTVRVAVPDVVGREAEAAEEELTSAGFDVRTVEVFSDQPEGTVDRLIIDTLPFDHPNHPIASRRKEHYNNGFEDYLLPRVQHRLFRLLRKFCRHRKPERSFR